MFLVIWHHLDPMTVELSKDNCNLKIWMVMIWMIGALVLTEWDVGATCECGASQNHLPQQKGMISGSAGIGRFYKISYTSHDLWKLLTEGVRSWQLYVTASLGKHIICNKGEWASSQCYVTDNVLLLRTNMYLPFWLVKSAKP